MVLGLRIITERTGARFRQRRGTHARPIQRRHRPWQSSSRFSWHSLHFKQVCARLALVSQFDLNR